MLAKNMLKMVSALNSKDIEELQYLFTPTGMTSTGHDISTLVSSYDTEELKAMLSPDEVRALVHEHQMAEYVFGQFEQVLRELRSVIQTLLVNGSAVDRQYYHKALRKLDELQNAV